MILNQEIYDSNYDIDSYPGVYDANIIFYDEDGEEDDELENWEEGFMEGATAAGQLGKDALTGEPLMNVEDVVETEIDGKVYRFVNEDNAQKFREKMRNAHS